MKEWIKKNTEAIVRRMIEQDLSFSVAAESLRVEELLEEDRRALLKIIGYGYDK